MYWLLKLLNVSPVLRVTDDTNFGTIEKSFTELRLSLISITLGPYIIFLFSYGFRANNTSHPKGFRFYYHLNFNDVHPRDIDIDKIKQLKDNHLLFLRTNNDSNKHAAYLETIKAKLEQAKDKRGKTFNKFLAYLAVIAFVLPLFIPPLLKIRELSHYPLWIQVVFYFLAVYLFLLFINMGYFLYRFVAVRNSIRFMYKEVKEATDPNEALINGLYTDYQVMDKESIIDVGVLRNIEKYMIGIGMISILIMGLYILTLPLKEQQTNADKPTISNYAGDVFKIPLNQSSEEMLKQSASFLNSLQSNLIGNNYRQIIIMRSGENFEENYSRIKNIIDSYNVHKLDILEAQDKTSTDNFLYIIFQGRDD